MTAKPKPLPGVRTLKRLAAQIHDLEHAIRAFRQSHPPGTGGPACDAVRETDRHCGIAGPTDALVAAEMVLWQTRHALAELNL